MTHIDASLFGFDLTDFWRSFLLFVATYLGSRHGTNGGNGNINGAH